MVIATLAVQGILQLGIGATFALVAQRVGQRAPHSPDARIAHRAFLAWWYGLGGYIAFLGFDAIAGAFGFASYPLFLAVRLVNIPLLCAALWGMLTYVIFMWRGNARVWRPAAIYAAGLGLAYYATTFLNTDGIVVAEFSAGLRDADPLYMNLVYAYFAIPLLSCIVAYGLLVRRVRGSEQRYRILMVASSLFLWVASGLFGEVSGNRVIAFATVSAFGMGASLVFLLAYQPPKGIIERLRERDARHAFSVEDGRRERAALAAWGPERPG